MSSVSKRSILENPWRPAQMLSQVEGTSFPTGVMAPMPVMTTRFMHFSFDHMERQPETSSTCPEM